MMKTARLLHVRRPFCNARNQAGIRRKLSFMPYRNIMDFALPLRRAGSAAAIAALLSASLFPVLAAQNLPAERAGTVAAVFPPSAAPERILRAVALADGAIVREGRGRNVIVVRSEAPGLAGRLRQAGAWLVLDPGGLAGCFAA
jgi:hypothetical protein